MEASRHHLRQRGRQVVLVSRRQANFLVQARKIGFQHSLEQALLAAEKVVEGRLGDAGLVHNLLHPHGVITVAGKQAQGNGDQVGAIIHAAIIPLGTALSRDLGIPVLSHAGC